MQRQWTRYAVLAVLLVSVPAFSVPTCRVLGIEVADFREQLESGLRVRLPREFRFIRNVVQLVVEDRLPLPLVRSTFEWARRKAVNGQYPFPYFERAMRLRAKRIGVTIPL